MSFAPPDGPTGMNLPDIVTKDEWLAARKALLVKEKQLTRARDALAADRRRLPMVRITKDYRFHGPTGEFGLADLFDGRRQLIVSHVMWNWEPDGTPRPVGCLVQPVSVRDTARIAIDAESRVVQDAAGPEVHEFGHFVRLIGRAVGSRTRIVSAPRTVALAFVRVGNAAVRDVVVTRDELDGLSRSLLTSSTLPLGIDRFSEWLRDNADTLGRRYESELRRNFRGQE